MLKPTAKREKPIGTESISMEQFYIYMTRKDGVPAVMSRQSTGHLGPKGSWLVKTIKEN